METATPAEIARAEDPGLSAAKEAAEAVSAESVRRNGHPLFNTGQSYFKFNLHKLPSSRLLRGILICLIDKTGGD